MSLEALITGTVHGTPAALTSSVGRTYAKARIRVPQAGGETLFVGVVAFDEAPLQALLALDAGDAVSVGGTLRVSAWRGNDGEPRPGAELVAAQVMSLYALKRRREAVKQEAQPVGVRALPAAEAPPPQPAPEGNVPWCDENDV